MLHAVRKQKTRPLLSNCIVKLTYLAPVAAMAVLVSAALHVRIPGHVNTDSGAM